MSMSGLNNSQLGMQLFLQIIDEFKSFIGGGGSNQNLFSFLDGNTEVDKEITKKLLSYAGVRDQEKEALDLVKKRVFFPLLDNTSFAYTISDIISGKAFKITNDSEITDLEKYLYIVYEDAAGKNLKNAQLLESDSGMPQFANSSKQASIKKMVTPVNTKFVDNVINAGDAFKDLVGDYEEDDKENPGTKKPILGNFAKTEQTMDDVFINGGNSANGDAIPEPSRYGSPGLCGFVVRRPDVGIMARNADPINLFFNAISPLEMSRCTPYINVAVVTLADEHRPKKMNNVTFMRFIKKDSTNYVLDEKIGLARATPQDNDMFQSLFNNNKFGENIARDVSLMDIFTTTQTTSNANINSPNESLKNTSLSNHVLEPISPFLTLNSLSVDISGMGIALFSSKVASMELTLHDRSRLADISSLVAPNQFGMTKVIIEYGWSHPEGGLDSTNRMGQLLNSARDRGIFTVKSSNFSFSDGNTVKVSLSLACYGADESKSISAAAGSKIPIAVFKPTIKKILNDLVENKKGNAKSDDGKRNLKHREVRQIINVAQRNSASTAALIEYKAYQDLVKLYYESLKTDGAEEINGEDYIEMLSRLMGDIDIAPGAKKKDLREAIKGQNKKREQDATQLLHGKLSALIGNMDPTLEDFTVDPFLAAVNDFADGKSIASEYFTKGTDGLPKPKVVSLGKIMMSFVGHSLAMSGLFDEVQMFFYPLNTNAAKARVHTTASMPIEANALKTVITKKIAADASVSINTIFNLVSRKLVRDNSSYAYGLTDIYTRYEEERKKAKELKEEVDTATKAATKDDPVSQEVKDKKVQATQIASDARDERKASVTERCQGYYSKDGGPTAESTFMRPEISLYIETLPSVTTTGAGLKSIVGSAPGLDKKKDGEDSDAKKYEKNICRIHIYDERAMAKPYESFLNSMLTEGSSGKTIVRAVQAEGSDGILSEVAVDNETGAVSGDLEDQLVNYVLNVPPSKIKSIIKKGYPSVTYGASTGVVKSIGVSSNVSDNVSQVLMISANAGTRDIHNNSEIADELEEMEIVPATVNLDMLGCPFIQRGNQIYIDFGTNTTLDNIYTVKSVKHDLSAGDFSTTVELMFTGQAKVSSVRDKIKTAIDSLI